MGFPIRKFPDQSLFAAPRNLSQRTTSFIASQRQGIHRIPFRHLIVLIIEKPDFDGRPFDVFEKTILLQTHPGTQRSAGNIEEDSTRSGCRCPAATLRSACARRPAFRPDVFPLHDVRQEGSRLLLRSRSPNPGAKLLGSALRLQTDKLHLFPFGVRPTSPQPALEQNSGGARRDRTDDLMLAKHALSQLSYGPS